VKRPVKPKPVAWDLLILTWDLQESDDEYSDARPDPEL
jgi:hypothetical protein